MEASRAAIRAASSDEAVPAASAETAAASPTAVAAAHPVERRAGSDSASGLPPIAVVVDHLETEVVVDYLVVGLQAACTAVRLRRVQRRPVEKAEQIERRDRPTQN